MKAECINYNYHNNKKYQQTKKENGFLIKLIEPIDQKRLNSFFYRGHVGKISKNGFIIEINAIGKVKLHDENIDILVADSHEIYVEEELLDTDQKLKAQLNDTCNFRKSNYFSLDLVDTRTGYRHNNKESTNSLAEAVELAKTIIQLAVIKKQDKETDIERQFDKKVKLLVDKKQKLGQPCECPTCSCEPNYKYGIGIYEIKDEVVQVDNAIHRAFGMNLEIAYSNAYEICRTENYYVAENKHNKGRL